MSWLLPRLADVNICARRSISPRRWRPPYGMPAPLRCPLAEFPAASKRPGDMPAGERAIERHEFSFTDAAKRRHARRPPTPQHAAVRPAGLPLMRAAASKPRRAAQDAPCRWRRSTCSIAGHGKLRLTAGGARPRACFAESACIYARDRRKKRLRHAQATAELTFLSRAFGPLTRCTLAAISGAPAGHAVRGQRQQARAHAIRGGHIAPAEHRRASRPLPSCAISRRQALMMARRAAIIPAFGTMPGHAAREFPSPLCLRCAAALTILESPRRWSPLAMACDDFPL